MLETLAIIAAVLLADAVAFIVGAKLGMERPLQAASLVNVLGALGFAVAALIITFTH